MNGLDYISPDNHMIIKIIPKIYFEHFWICEGGVREDDAPSGNQILFKQSDLKSDLPPVFCFSCLPKWIPSHLIFRNKVEIYLQ